MNLRSSSGSLFCAVLITSADPANAALLGNYSSHATLTAIEITDAAGGGTARRNR